MKYKKKTETGSNRPVSVRFSLIILYKKLKPNQLVSVWFCLILVRFGYFILKTKRHIVFWALFRLFDGFWFWFGSVFF